MVRLDRDEFIEKIKRERSMYLNNPQWTDAFVKHPMYLSQRYSTIKNGDLTEEQWQDLLAEHDHSCHWCGIKSDKLTKDHVIAISRGGLHTRSNIVPCCRSCNLKKHAKSLDIWAKIIAPSYRNI